MTSASMSYEATNRVGRTLRTFNCQELGKQWVRSNAGLHDGLILEAVETVQVRRRVYRPRVVS